MKRTILFATAMLAGCATAAKITNDISTACAWAQPVLASISVIAPNPYVPSVQAACTVAGQVQMTINDTLPVTPTNSGSSATWVVATTQAAAGTTGVVAPPPPK